MENQFQNCSSSSCFWDNSPMDNQTDPLESALSSMVSSPTAISNPPQNLNVLRELIGRLGTICNSAEISPPHHQIGISNFSSDLGFVERAARFSSFKFNPQSDNSVDNNPSPSVQESLFTPENVEFGESRENSSVSEQIPPLNSRKRKSDIIPKPQGKTKETAKPAAAAYVASENSESVAKRSKSEDGNEKNKSNKASSSSASKDKTPAPKDYIHVRARRGQATDAHSLAERVRREKISERMKVLQDLVPGCNKVTGKAVMLDEIINYVQSLQRQVEFLSMKLAAVNPRTEFSGVSASKDGLYNMHHHSSESSYHHFPSQLHMIPRGVNQVDNFGGSQQAYWEDDLHSFVQMGFGQTNNTNGAGGIRMKVEL